MTESRNLAAPWRCWRRAPDSGNRFWFGMAERYRIVPSEGGHSDFAPHTEQQIELLRFMRRRYPQVSWELILSGRGFRTLHEFLAPEVKHHFLRGSRRGSCAGNHDALGLAKTCPVCVETLDLWTSIYGAEAGNLALKVLALGGVYVAGGIAVKIIEKMKDGKFVSAFQGQVEV